MMEMEAANAQSVTNMRRHRGLETSSEAVCHVERTNISTILSESYKLVIHVQQIKLITRITRVAYALKTSQLMVMPANARMDTIIVTLITCNKLVPVSNVVSTSI